MLLLPYKADVDLGRLPVLTLIVCAICIGVFARQEFSARAYRESLLQYCNHQVTRDERLVLKYLDSSAGESYCDVLLQIRAAPDRTAAIQKLADTSKATPFYRDKDDSTAYVYNALLESSHRFERAIPNDLTEQLQYDPSQPNIWRMITAAFSHADWWHLVSNLIFFFAFAASMEVIAGYFYYFGFILTAAIGTHLAYSYSMTGVDEVMPTSGLSGVVMAMMAFLATVAPRLRIRCVFWFVVIILMFRVPALGIAALYVAKNIFEYAQRDPDVTVNYVAHISGAAIGVLLGLIYRLSHREFLRAITHGI